MTTRKKRNGKIDFLKLIFAIIVVFYHTKHVVGDINAIFPGGNFAVEFFFMVSGYLMMASIKKLPAHPVSLGRETKDFLIRKYKSFCPELILANIIAFAVTLAATKTGFFNLLASSFSELLLINMSGLWVTKINNAIWYLSSMLLAMAILYPLLRKFGDTALYIVIPLLSLLVMGWFCGNKEPPRNSTEWIGWTYRGNLRALAKLGVGICLYPIVEKVKQLNFTVFGRCLMTLAEYALYTFIVYFMYTQTASQQDYFYLALLAVALIISFSEKGIDAPLFSGRFAWLGKYSFALYLSHYFYSQTIKTFLPDFSDKRLLIAYYSISALTALAVMFSSDLIRKIIGAIAAKRKPIEQ